MANKDICQALSDAIDLEVIKFCQNKNIACNGCKECGISRFATGLGVKEYSFSVAQDCNAEIENLMKEHDISREEAVLKMYKGGE